MAQSQALVKASDLTFTFIATGSDGWNITIIISELCFSTSQGTNVNPEILGTFNLGQIRMFLTIVDSIQLKLFGVMLFLA